MPLADVLLVTLAAPAALISLYALGACIYGVRALPDPFQDPATLATWPKLSIITPACDEEAEVASALRTMLSQDYPALQLVAVNDRSTDRTGTIIDGLASEDRRVVPVHVTELPDGWLGKLNALQRGVERADGDWLLFADADAHLAPGALRSAVAFAESRGFDFVSVLPMIESAGFLGDAVFSMAQVALFAASRPWRVPDPASPAVAATGAFMLVRRTAFDRTPGFAWMPLEVADDFGLCLMIKSHGGRCVLAHGRRGVHLHWYRSLGEMAAKMQKNFYAITGRFSVVRMALQAAVLAVFASVPLLMLVPTDAPLLRVLPPIATAALTAASVHTARHTGRPILASCVPFLGVLLTAGMTIRSAIVGHRIQGITWRGVRYPKSVLAPRQRVKV